MDFTENALFLWVIETKFNHRYPRLLLVLCHILFFLHAWKTFPTPTPFWAAGNPFHTRSCWAWGKRGCSGLLSRDTQLTFCSCIFLVTGILGPEAPDLGFTEGRHRSSMVLGFPNLPKGRMVKPTPISDHSCSLVFLSFSRPWGLPRISSKARGCVIPFMR